MVTREMPVSVYGSDGGGNVMVVVSGGGCGVVLVRHAGPIVHRQLCVTVFLLFLDSNSEEGRSRKHMSIKNTIFIFL